MDGTSKTKRLVAMNRVFDEMRRRTHEPEAPPGRGGTGPAGQGAVIVVAGAWCGLAGPAETGVILDGEG